MAQPISSTRSTAILAGGCFWCVESDLEKLNGVVDVVSGYSGGSRQNPTYENYHDTDTTYPVPHVEVVQVTYNPSVIDYGRLVDYFLRHIDPTDGGGQFCDRGPAYRPVIFVANDTERTIAHDRIAFAQKVLNTPIAVEVLDAGTFWPAEDYHQDYHRKNPTRYSFYRWNCGRDKRVQKIWSNVSETVR